MGWWAKEFGRKAQREASAKETGCMRRCRLPRQRGPSHTDFPFYGGRARGGKVALAPPVVSKRAPLLQQSPSRRPVVNAARVQGLVAKHSDGAAAVGLGVQRKARCSRRLVSPLWDSGAHPNAPGRAGRRAEAPVALYHTGCGASLPPPHPRPVSPRHKDFNVRPAQGHRREAPAV